MSGGCDGGGTKSLRLLPRISHLSLSLSPSLSLSLFPFSPAAFPRISLLVPRFRPPRSPSSFLPFRHGGLSRSFFFSSRYASFYATAQPRFVPVSRPLPSSSDTRNRPISFSLFLHRSPSASLAPELNHLRRFFADTPRLPSSLTCKPIAHASERTRRSEPR